MKVFSLMALSLVFSAYAMEDQKSQLQEVNHRSFPSVAGEDVARVQDRIIVKEGTFFSSENCITIYDNAGKGQGAIRPEKELGSALIPRPGTSQFVAPYADGIALFDVETGKIIREFFTDEIKNSSLSWNFKFTKDGNNLLVTKRGSVNGETYLYDVNTDNNKYQHDMIGYDYINAEGTKAVSVPLLGFLGASYARSFDVKSQKPIETFPYEGTAGCICTPDVLKLVQGVEDKEGNIVSNQVVNTLSGKLEYTIPIKCKQFFNSAVSPDGRYLMQVTDDIMGIYDLQEKKLVRTLTVPSLLLGIWLSQDNKELITVANGANSLPEQKKKQSYQLKRSAKIQDNTNFQPQEAGGQVDIWTDLGLEAPSAPSKSWWPW